MTKLVKPRALKDGLIITPRREELMIFDLENHLSHLLDKTAALVWRLSDGEKTLEELIRTAGRESGGSATRAKIIVALRQLRQAKLLNRLSLGDLGRSGAAHKGGNSAGRPVEQVLFVRTVDCDVKRRARRRDAGPASRGASRSTGGRKAGAARAPSRP